MSEEFLDPNLVPDPFGVIWNQPLDRKFFAGVDRGMLYREYGPGVSWTGLVSVTESPANGKITPFYLDGVRRRNDQIADDFTANISAYAYPPEFSECVGEAEIAPGLYLGEQIREPFGFSYRNFIGDAVSDLGTNYEIHVVYNALAESSGRTHNTLSNSPDPGTYSWDISTVPEDFDQRQPSAHIKISSLATRKDRFSEIEYILYGTDTVEPRLPSISELYSIVSRPDQIVIDEDIPWDPDMPLEP